MTVTRTCIHFVKFSIYYLPMLTHQLLACSVGGAYTLLFNPYIQVHVVYELEEIIGLLLNRFFFRLNVNHIMICYMINTVHNLTLYRML